MDRGAEQATVMGSQRVRHDLNMHAHTHTHYKIYGITEGEKVTYLCNIKSKGKGRRNCTRALFYS